MYLTDMIVNYLRIGFVRSSWNFLILILETLPQEMLLQIDFYDEMNEDLLQNLLLHFYQKCLAFVQNNSLKMSDLLKKLKFSQICWCDFDPKKLFSTNCFFFV